MRPGWGRSNTVSEDLKRLERRGNSPVKEKSKDSLNAFSWEFSLAGKKSEREQCNFPFWKVSPSKSNRRNMLTKEREFEDRV